MPFFMPLKIIRFADIKQRGIANSWTQVRRLQKLHNFPLGRMCGGHTRTWTEAEVDEWYFAQPVEGPELRGAAKLRRNAVGGEISDREHEEGPAARSP
jgi:hypothetical protein